MKRLFSFFISIGIVFFVASTVAFADNGNGCNLQGSWMGIGSVIIVTYTGQSTSSGTSNEEIPAFDPILFGYFPDAVKMSDLYGMWERTGGNTFAYTQVAYALDASGNVQYIVKNSGNKTLTENCNLMTVKSTLEIFVPPDDNPFEDEPYFCWSLDDTLLQRMRIYPQCDY